MKTLAMKLAVALLNFVYLGIRLLPVKNKILFISRQANVPSHDIDLLVQAVKKQMPEVQAKVLTKTLDAGLQAKLGYCLHLALQMYHIATSRAVILDGYCIAASVLTHKKETVFIQMWHASCALKKFGWQTVGRSSGSSRRTASIMKMHRNYNYVLTSSKRTGNTYCEGFHISENQLIYIGMPHYTMLVGEDQRLKRRMTANYPQLKGKINILYIPTFRKKEKS